MLMMTSCFVDHVLVELHGIEGHFFAAYNTFLHFDLKCQETQNNSSQLLVMGN